MRHYSRTQGHDLANRRATKPACCEVVKHLNKTCSNKRAMRGSMRGRPDRSDSVQPAGGESESNLLPCRYSWFS